MTRGCLQAFDDVVFDFDGTLAHLVVDWYALRRAALEEFPQARRISASPALGEIVALVSAEGGWPARRRLADLLRSFEQPDGEVHSTPIDRSVRAARELSRFYVISNNLSSTVRLALTGMELDGHCGFVVGFDAVLRSKPADDAFHALAKAMPLGRRVAYVGDRDSDRIFAEACGLAFLQVSELCE